MPAASLLSVENCVDQMTPQGDAELTKDRRRLALAKRLKAVLDATVKALEADEAPPEAVRRSQLACCPFIPGVQVRHQAVPCDAAASKPAPPAWSSRHGLGQPADAGRNALAARAHAAAAVRAGKLVPAQLPARSAVGDVVRLGGSAAPARHERPDIRTNGGSARRWWQRQKIGCAGFLTPD